MKPVKITPGVTQGGHFATTTRNTGLSQRATLEQTLSNLAAVWGADALERLTSGRGGVFYRARSGGVAIQCQSGSNVVLELSRYLLERAGKAQAAPVCNATDAPDPAVAAIQFALTTDEGLAFLRCWNEGNFDAIRREWPEAPPSVFAGADPYRP
jgi:hypothetical protein